MIVNRVASVFVGWTACLFAIGLAAGQSEFHPPDGFAIEPVAGPPEIQFPMFACFDDCGRLYVADRLKTGWVIPSQQLRSVLEALPVGERAKAEEAFKDARQSTDIRDQAAKLAEYEPLLKGEDSARGRTLFFSKSVTETTVHSHVPQS